MSGHDETMNFLCLDVRPGKTQNGLKAKNCEMRDKNLLAPQSPLTYVVPS
jgi:hypothetical protein